MTWDLGKGPGGGGGRGQTRNSSRSIMTTGQLLGPGEGVGGGGGQRADKELQQEAHTLPGPAVLQSTTK